jgi:hypothetical protein
MGTLVPIDGINERWLWRCQELKQQRIEDVVEVCKSKKAVVNSIGTPTTTLQKNPPPSQTEKCTPS